MDVDTVAPHGGHLVDLIVTPDRRRELKEAAVGYPSWRLTPRQLCDLELLASGGFSPLQGFLSSADYLSVCESMRLVDGTLWPMPITLDVPEGVVRTCQRTGSLALRDEDGVMVAALHVTEAWRPDRESEAFAVFGTTSHAHPGVDHLLRRTHPWYVSGRLEVLEPVRHYSFPELRLTPAGLRAAFKRRGWKRVVAFNTRNPMHRAHVELTMRGARDADAKLLIHPVVGLTQPGDVDADTRVRCYRALMPSFPQGAAMLAVLPLAMRMAGPREALWHALIRQNHGATHFIVGRDHAGPRPGPSGKPFYAPYAAQGLVQKHEAELGIQVLQFRKMVYLQQSSTYVEEDEAPRGHTVLQISGTELRKKLREGAEIPGWFTFPAVARELQRRFRPRADQGFTVLITGLPGAGKSAIARALVEMLRDRTERSITLLDGDEARHLLSAELGYSKEDRERHVLRAAYVATEVTKSGGAVVCAHIAPYAATRREVRRLIEPWGGFLLVHVTTPLDTCEARDPKGMYAKARAGLVPHFTGVSDSYEIPWDADLVVGAAMTPDQSAVRIVEALDRRGFLPSTAESSAVTA